VIFVASPLHGAMILNNRPLLRNMADDACNSLLAGPTSSIIASIMMRKVFGNLGSLCNTFSGDVLDLFVSQYYDEITESYTVGLEGSLIETFNNDHQNNPDYCDLPKISVVSHIDLYTTESNILWRTANWLVNDPNDEPHFGANDDQKFLIEVVFPAYINYFSNVIEFENKYRQCRRGFIGSIVGGVLTGGAILGSGGVTTSVLMGKQYLERKNAYQKGIDWLAQANDQWNVVIGADYLCYPNGYWRRKASDGIVLAEAQEGLPCSSWIAVATPGSHMQIRNNEGIKEMLNHIFNGYGNREEKYKFFYTKPK
jgi:hypothetical protein